MAAIIPRPTSGTLSGAPDMFSLLDDLDAAEKDRYEHPAVATVDDLSSFSAVPLNFIVYVTGARRFYVYTPTGFAPLDNMVNDATYGWVPRVMAGTTTVSLGASGDVIFSLPFGRSIAGAEKYVYSIQNANPAAPQPATVKGWVTPGTGTQTGITTYVSGAAAGGCQLGWVATYKQ